jgi:hypothetical protein
VTGDVDRPEVDRQKSAGQYRPMIAMRPHRVVPVAVSLVVGCAGLVTGCGPAVDAAAKADIDGRVAALHAPGDSFPGPMAFAPMPLAAGQWTQHKMTNDKGEPSFVTYKILGEEGGAFWVESVQESYTGKMIQDILVAFGNRMDPAQIEIRAVKTKDAKGRVNELPPGMMPMLQAIYKNAVSMLVVNWQGLPQADAAVPAGRFTGCFRARTDAQWAGFRSVSESWSHPAVPISGMVKSQGIDRPFTMELVAFGLTGAVSEF